MQNTPVGQLRACREQELTDDAIATGLVPENVEVDATVRSGAEYSCDAKRDWRSRASKSL